MAASVKPTLVLLGPVILAMSLVELRKSRAKLSPFIGWSLAGASMATCIVLGFLLKYGALTTFLFDLEHVLPHYSSVGAANWSTLLGGTLQLPIFVYVGLASIAALIDRNWLDWEGRALLCGLAFGLFNFYSQRKGFGQHRYTTVAFVLLLATMQVFLSLRGRGIGRAFAAAAIAFGMLFDIPRNLQWIYRYKSYDNFSSYLMRDLQRMNPDRLQGKIQCLDIVDGCLNALYHLQIVQSNGSTGDLLLFLPGRSTVIEDARKNFMAELRANPPEVFFLSNEPFTGKRSFGKVNNWPAFAMLLSSEYEPVIQRDFGDDPPTSHIGQDSDVQAYRIYLRKGSSFVPQTGSSTQ